MDLYYYEIHKLVNGGLPLFFFSLLQIQSSLPTSSLPELSEPTVMTFTAGSWL
jgi:hypothetical protein